MICESVDEAARRPARDISIFGRRRRECAKFWPVSADRGEASPESERCASGTCADTLLPWPRTLLEEIRSRCLATSRSASRLLPYSTTGARRSDVLIAVHDFWPRRQIVRECSSRRGGGGVDTAPVPPTDSRLDAAPTADMPGVTAGAPVGGNRQRFQGLATAGLVLVLLSASGFALWSSQSTSASAQRAITASRLADSFAAAATAWRLRSRWSASIVWSLARRCLLGIGRQRQIWSLRWKLFGVPAMSRIESRLTAC